MDRLPDALKLMVLAGMSSEAQSAALGNDATNRLEPVRLLPPLDEAVEPLQLLREAQLQALDQGPGYFVVDNFLGSDAPGRVRAEMQGLRDQGLLRQAGMGTSQAGAEGAPPGSSGGRWRDRRIRGDQHLWIHNYHAREHAAVDDAIPGASPNASRSVLQDTPNLLHLLDRLDALRHELNRCCAFSCDRTQVQVTCYPGEGTRYARHLDAKKGKSTRRLTCLWYGNVGWQPEHGGQLRIYSPGSEEYVDIEPIGDRLVVFQSRSIEHEVLPAHADRYAVTLWFY